MTGGFAFTIMKDYVELHDGILVSIEDVDLQVRRLISQDYAYVRINSKAVPVHRIVMRRILMVELPKHLVVDHINRNKRDNRRENLRLVDRSGNTRNAAIKQTSKSKYRHVCLHNRKKPFYVSIKAGGKVNNFGSFASEEEAAFHADVWAYRVLPEIAELNFPERIAEIEAEALKIQNKHWPFQRKTFYAHNHADVLAFPQL